MSFADVWLPSGLLLFLLGGGLAGCSDDGGSGACSDSDCITPPAALCDGDTRVTFGFIGACEAGQCAYPRTERVCDGGCEAGVCLTPSTCDPAACVAPAPSCDGDLRVAAVRPSCDEDGACQFEEERQTCDFGCSDGQCVDPCALVDCAPPAPTCDGAVRVERSISCVGGECIEGPETRTDCSASGETCADGICVPADRCADVVCELPTAPFCEGPIVVEPLSIACDPSNGRCDLTSRRTNCSLQGLGCVDGACVDVGPCADVLCLDPPSPSCDGDTIAAFLPEGTCDEGVCGYDPDPTDCAATGQFCFDARCVSTDPCSVVSCDSPPRARCDGDVAVQSLLPGTCRSGVCSFSEARVDCAESGRFCAGGECVLFDPCADVLCDAPPTPRCEGNRVRAFASMGTCGGGACTYTRDDIDCTATGQFCNGGACTTTDPCTGVACVDPPTDFCDGLVAVRHSGAATCSSGLCSYSSQRVNCGALGGTCSEGDCVLPDPCDDVVCDAPPTAVCDGRVALQYPAIGLCDGGTCSYTAITDDCRDYPGGFCQGGVCSSTDPCFRVECEDPFPSVCNGRTAVHYTLPGACTSGACLYTEAPEDCTVYVGGFCFDGACGSTDPCFRVECETPPSPSCDGDTLRTFSLPGGCEVGRCVYTVDPFDCREIPDGYCFDGRCRSTDPCYEVDCSTPPAPICDGDNVITFVGEGTCDAGRCSFAREARDCAADGLFCFEGACLDRDLCLGVTCGQPPAPACLGAVGRVYDPVGTCAAGTCSYTFADEDCSVEGGYCVGGFCVSDDPCVDVVCDSPPTATCSGDAVLTFLGDGVCVAGDCLYSRTRLDCDTEPGGTCIDAACTIIDPCEGVTCAAPPAPFCDGNTSVVPEGVGTCSLGTCNFAQARENCAATGRFCFEGACIEPTSCIATACNEPPGASCDGDLAQTWQVPGSCIGDECAYNALTVDCSLTGEVCFAGSCQADPRCGGVFCNTAPAGRCEGELAFTFNPFGSCVGGACEYQAVTRNCAAIGQTCAQGQCIDFDPCEGLSCNAPPADRCQGDTAVRFASAGVCVRGDCVYAPIEEDCSARGEFCSGNGSCVATEPCEGVVCEGTAGTLCEGNTRIELVLGGVCANGVCPQTRVPTDCAASGLVCDAGECVEFDPCRNVMCLSPPANACEGDVAVRWAESGTCDDGECTYARTQENCAATGRFCSVGGVCVADDPCAATVCDDPPPASCDGTTPVAYAASGTCEGGACFYTETRGTDCAASGLLCFDGQCLATDPCAGVNCATPPAPTCSDAVLSESLGAGSCRAGTCEFDLFEVPCTDRLRSFCDEDDRAVVRSNHRCDGASCAADEVVDDCPARGLDCVEGRCELPCGPCAPEREPECLGSIAIRSAGPTFCDGPSCRNDIITENCAASGQFCDRGFCVEEPPCDASACLPLPAAECIGTNVRRAYTSAFCGNGVCEYVGTDTECTVGQTCIDGQCVTATCSNVSCTSPPINRCDAGVAVQYASAGTCADGLCSYAETRTDCSSIDQFCFAGACEEADRCVDATCVDGREFLRFCANQGADVVAVVQTETDSCADGACILTEVRTNCTSVGALCVDGTCIAP